MERRRTRTSASRRHRHERWRAALVGVVLVGAVFTSVAFVAGAGGRSRHVFTERDPLRERIESDLEASSEALAGLGSQIAPTAQGAGEREACRVARHREALAIQETLRDDVEAFRAATRSTDSIARLRAADRARADHGRLRALLDAISACR